MVLLPIPDIKIVYPFIKELPCFQRVSVKNFYAVNNSVGYTFNSAEGTTQALLT